MDTQGRPADGRVALRSRPMTLPEYVADILSRRLFEGQLQPGARISSHSIAKDLQISHIPVREALRGLEAAGHVTWIPQRGFFVAELALEDVEDIYRCRRLLEDEAHALSVPALTEEDLERLAAAYESMDVAIAQGDRAAFAWFNRDFHFIPFERAGGVQLLRLLNALWDSAARYQAALVREVGELEELQADHRRLLEAYRAGDLETTCRIMETHRAATLSKMKAALSPATGPGA